MAMRAGPIRFYMVHLSDVSSEARMAQIDELMKVFVEPAFVMGDMNFRYSEPEYARFRARFSDAWVVAGHRESDGVSVDGPFSGPARTDYMFITPSLARHVRGMRIDNDATGSDHYPVFLEIEIPEGGFGACLFRRQLARASRITGTCSRGLSRQLRAAFRRPALDSRSNSRPISLE